ncbi:MAG: hypothetical protein LBS54_08685 [Dysgonamonadaceae bacterium]|jgi:hypothetical protein|nr:hypothetical protein [Dysgonamonadaceae bacterium]
MKKFIYFLFAFTFFAVMKTNAQVTIGATSNPNVTLEIVGKPTDNTVADGLIIPRITGDQLVAKVITGGKYADVTTFEGTLVYVTSAPTTAQTGVLKNVKAPGYYYFDKAKNCWKGIASTDNLTEWFYMPPYPINTEAGENKTIDLYQAYAWSILGEENETGFAIKSAGAPDFSTLQPVLSATDFYYFVVGYDPELFTNISITAAGVLKYTIPTTAVADDESYITIVFARK